jgi:hypothetical protein
MCAFMKYYWFMICKPIKVTMCVVSKMDLFYLAMVIVFNLPVLCFGGFAYIG